MRAVPSLEIVSAPAKRSQPCVAAGPNCRDRIRCGLLYDYHAAGGDRPAPAGMWDEWSEEVRAAPLLEDGGPRPRL